MAKFDVSEPDGLVVIDVKDYDNLQEKIEYALSPEKQADVITLQIDGACKPATLCHRLTNLTTLRLYECGDVWAENPHLKLHLTAKLTPNLADVELRSLPDNCDFRVVLPTLKRFSVEHFAPGHPDGDTGSINAMLAAATKLEVFDTYKLRAVTQLKFASNNLRYISLHRSESLKVLSIWAPNLKQLDLRGCYSLDRIAILTSHPSLSRDLQRSHEPTTFSVNTRNANLGPSARAALENNRRCAIMENKPTNDPLNLLEAMMGAMARTS